jgi:predicted kinase
MCSTSQLPPRPHDITDTRFPIAILGVGVPGVGKTTSLSDLAAYLGWPYVCPDDIRLELCGDVSDQSQNRKVWELTYEQIEKALADTDTVIVDATNANACDRIKLARHCRIAGARWVEAHWFRAALTECYLRNDLRRGKGPVPDIVIEKMAASLYHDPPHPDDGFDTVITIWTDRCFTD